MTVINLRTNNKYDLRIDRKTKWGNPFVMKRESEREHVVQKYELWLNTQPNLLVDLPSLKGKSLACWCAPKACHGDVLVKLSQSKWIKNWFSNMSKLEFPFVEDGISYYTSENYYQAQKVEPELRYKIVQMNPFEAKKSIRDRQKFPWRSTWSKDESLEVMEKILRFKFSQNKWANLLAMTEDWEITEWNNWNDIFWGKDIRSRKGENHLGKILMNIRDNKNGKK